MVRDPQRAVRFVELLWESIQRLAGSIGRHAADAILNFFQLPDDRFGEESGRFAGGFIIDALIGVFTAGAGTLVRQAASAAGRVARMLRGALRAGREILQLIHAVVEPLIEGARGIGRLFQRTTFGGWMERFQLWLRRMLDAARRTLAPVAEATVRGGRRAAQALSEAVQQLIRRVRAMAERVFEGLGFRGYDVEVHGEWLVLYGLRSKHKLLAAKLYKRGRNVVPQDRQLFAAMLKARARLLNEARRAGKAKKAYTLRGRATRLSEQIGERAAITARTRLPSPPRRRLFTGTGSGVFDLVYKLEDGTVAIIEAKGGRGRLGTRIGRGGRDVQQGTMAYVREILREMRRPSASAAEKRAAAAIQDALDNGRLRYFLAKTPIRKGRRLKTTLAEFMLR
jgi:hypothetical protein